MSSAVFDSGFANPPGPGELVERLNGKLVEAAGQLASIHDKINAGIADRLGQAYYAFSNAQQKIQDDYQQRMDAATQTLQGVYATLGQAVRSGIASAAEMGAPYGVKPPGIRTPRRPRRGPTAPTGAGMDAPTLAGATAPAPAVMTSTEAGATLAGGGGSGLLYWILKSDSKQCYSYGAGTPIDCPKAGSPGIPADAVCTHYPDLASLSAAINALADQQYTTPCGPKTYIWLWKSQSKFCFNYADLSLIDCPPPGSPGVPADAVCVHFAQSSLLYATVNSLLAAGWLYPCPPPPPATCADGTNIDPSLWPVLQPMVPIPFCLPGQPPGTVVIYICPQDDADKLAAGDVSGNWWSGPVNSIVAFPPSWAMFTLKPGKQTCVGMKVPCTYKFSPGSQGQVEVIGQVDDLRGYFAQPNLNLTLPPCPPSGGGGGGNGCPPPCPTLTIPPELTACLCGIKDALGKIQKLNTQPISFLTAAAGSKQGDDGFEDLWAGDPDETALLGDPPAKDEAFETIPVSAAIGAVPPPRFNLNGSGAAVKAESLGTLLGTGTGNGLSTSGIDTSQLGNLFNLDWNSPDVCQGVLELRKVVGTLRFGHVLQWLGITNDQGQIKFLSDAWDALKDDNSVSGRIKKSLYTTANNAICAAVNGLDALVAQLGPAVVGNVWAQVVGTVIDSINGFLSRWGGLDTTALTDALRYTLVAISPRQLPSAGDATVAYLRNQISYDLWQCWVMANNQLPGPAEKIMLAGQSQLAEGDLLRAWLRGLLDPNLGDPDDAGSKARNDQELLKRLRNRGWLDRDSAEILKRLTEQVPGPADLVRFMLRDVEDPNIVERFGLNEEFPQKYRGQVKRWFSDQGVSEKLALYEWRAHWQNMPWTQLREMLFRLRPDKYDGQKDPAGYPYRVSADDVFAALGQNDVPPFWRYKMMEVSYNLPRLIDMRRAYFSGVIGDADVRSDLLDRGNSPATVDMLVPVYRRLRRDQLRRHRLVKLYQSNALGEADARQLLANEGYRPNEVDDAIAYADLEADAAVQAQCIRRVGQRYERGEIPKQQLPQVLQGFNLSAKQVTRLAEHITCTLQTKAKELTAQQICNFFGQGILTELAARGRLSRLGYSDDDADRMFAKCQIDVAAKEKKKAAADKKEADKGKKKLSQAQVLRMVKRREMQPAEAQQRLVEIGYLPADAQRLIADALQGK